MFAHLKDFVVVSAYSPQALAERDLATLRETIVATKPDFWEESEPGMFLAFFLVTRGGRTKSLKLNQPCGTARNGAVVLPASVFPRRWESW